MRMREGCSETIVFQSQMRCCIHVSVEKVRQLEASNLRAHQRRIDPRCSRLREYENVAGSSVCIRGQVVP